MRIKFDSNDNLPTDNIVNMHQVTIITGSGKTGFLKILDLNLKNMFVTNVMIYQR